MTKPRLSQRASTRRANAIKKIKCMTIPNVEAGFVQLAHQAMLHHGETLQPFKTLGTNLLGIDEHKHGFAVP